MAKLERTTFEVSRASEYFDARQLSALTGVPQTVFASVCLKELVDNSLDACETSGVEPEIGIDVGGAVRARSLSPSRITAPASRPRLCTGYSTTRCAFQIKRPTVHLPAAPRETRLRPSLASRTL
jgi:hypothetical protein